MEGEEIMEFTKEMSDKLKNAKSKEEVMDILGEPDVSELSMDELENVSGGEMSITKIPPTHDEVDRLWDTIESVYNTYGKDVALVMARNVNAYAGSNHNWSAGDVRDLRKYRRRMHDHIDGKIDMNGLERFVPH